MQGPFTFAWVQPDETTFDASHIRFDEDLFNLTLSQEEGGFASAECEIRNPRIGLLKAGRPVWVWIGYNRVWEEAAEDSSADFADTTPMFFGRIVGLPADLSAETVRIMFTARPEDFNEQKLEVAESLKVAPYFDPIWFSPESLDDPDNVLESRGALWHVDPATHVVSVSSITDGEDGTITVTADDAFYDSVSITFGDSPCRRINVTATITWDQVASGWVPVIGGGGGLNPLAIIQSYTGEGLLASWPKAGTTIGGGWSVGGSTCIRGDGGGPDVWGWDKNRNWKYGWASGGKAVVVAKWEYEGNPIRSTLGVTPYPAHMLVVKKHILFCYLDAYYNASRGKTEIVQFTMESDVQPIITDSPFANVQELTMSSSEVVSPVDPGGAMPIGNPRERSYITTDRGQQSLEYLFCVARARLIASARCVDVAFDISWPFAVEQELSLRKNIVIFDNRIPGGQAAGKIKSYSYTIDGDSGAMICSVVIGCTIGRGGEVEEVVGEPDYVEAGFVDKGYQRYSGEYVMPIASEIAYSPINGLPPVDDGIDFKRMTKQMAFQQQLQIAWEADMQSPFIQTSDTPEEIYTSLNENAQTHISFAMRPLNSGPFLTVYPVDVTELKIPKTIDLEAESTV